MTMRKSFLLTVFLLIIPLASAVGIGISPVNIYFKDVLKGGYAENKVIVENPTNVKLQYQITVEGETNDWLSFYPGDTFTIPPNSRKEIILIIQPPDDVSPGTYTGRIIVEPVSIPSSVASKYGASIKVGATADVIVTVTGEENIEYDVDVDISDSLKGGSDSSAKLSISYTNKGNVDVTPKIHVDVWDRDQTRIVKSVDFEGEKVKPTKEGTQEFELLTKDLTHGQYWADITVRIDGKIIKQEMLTFDVRAPGAPIVRGELIHIINDVWVHVGDLVPINAEFENTG
ncbi:MAG: COG1470 family protein, partial [Candidatus Thorarchaeota archaeon]